MVDSLQTDAHARIARAIAAAEAETSGEIFCVLARRVSSYRDVTLIWAAMAALVLPLVLIPLGFVPDWSFGGWSAANAAPGAATGQALAAYAAVQSLVFVAVYLLGLLPRVRRWMTPRAIRRSRVRRAAMEQFLAHGLHVTEARTGVLLFACLTDHQIEVVADEGIHAKVDAGVWGDAAATLVDGLKRGDPAGGFEAAVKACGVVLAQHFPPSPGNPDEVANRLVVI